MKSLKTFSESKHLQRKKISRCTLLACGITLTTGLTTFEASAQAADVATSSAGTLESIVVTARKVAEKEQEVPVTITAFSAADLEKANIVKTTDLNNLTPGMNFQEGTGRAGSGRFFIRGLTGGVAGTTRASVFMDGVYVANSVSNILFGEMERVEVLLGPQSAQFGRATFGGALNYITKSPSNKFSGNIAMSVASLGEQNFDGFVGGPLIPDKLFASMFIGYQKFEGPKRWRNPPDVLHPDGVQVGSTETKMGAFKLVWLPTDDLRVSFRYSDTKDHDAPTLSHFLIPSQRNGTYTQNRTTCTGTVCVPGPSIPAYYFSGILNFDYSGTFPNAARNFDQEQDPSYRNETQRSTLIADYSFLNHNLKLTVGSNREKTPHGEFADSDFGVFPASRFTPNATTIKDNSAELRLDSSQNNKFRYSAGVYYLKTKATLNSKSIADYFCNNVCTPTSGAAIFNTQTLTGFTGSIGGSLNRFVGDFNTRSGVENASVFAGFFYDFTDKWNASLEGRYQKEKVTNINISNPAAPIGGTVEFKKFLPRATVQYKVSNDAQIYAVYSEGNNPGGLNTAVQIGRPGTGTTEAQRFIKEEQLLNYELGFKTIWFNNSLRLNASVFRMDWKDLQNTATYFDPASTFFGITENRGLARIDGFGVEGEWAVSKSLTFQGNVGYQNGRYLKFCSVQYANLLFGPAPAAPNGLQGGDPACLAEFKTRSVNVSGNKTETAPAKTGAINVDYHIPVMNGWMWALRGGIQYADGQFESEANLAKSPKAVLYNVGTEFSKGNWTFNADCRNCSDEDSPARTTRLTDPSAASTASNAGGLGYNQTIGNTLRRPRQVGISVRYKF